MIYVYVVLAWWLWVGAWFIGRFMRSGNQSFRPIDINDVGELLMLLVSLLLLSALWPLIFYFAHIDEKENAGRGFRRLDSPGAQYHQLPQ